MDVQVQIKQILDNDPHLIAAGLTPLYEADEVPDDPMIALMTIEESEEENTERTSGSIYAILSYELKVFSDTREGAGVNRELIKDALPDGTQITLPGLYGWCLLVRHARYRLRKEDDGGYRTAWSCQIDLEVTVRTLRRDQGISG